MENTLNYLLLKQREQYIRVPFSVVNCYLYVVNYGQLLLSLFHMVLLEIGNERYDF